MSAATLTADSAGEKRRESLSPVQTQLQDEEGEWNVALFAQASIVHGLTNRNQH